jgi:hypothetical protein
MKDNEMKQIIYNDTIWRSRVLDLWYEKHNYARNRQKSHSKSDR